MAFFTSVVAGTQEVLRKHLQQEYMGPKRGGEDPKHTVGTGGAWWALWPRCLVLAAASSRRSLLPPLPSTLWAGGGAGRQSPGHFGALAGLPHYPGWGW